MLALSPGLVPCKPPHDLSSVPAAPAQNAMVCEAGLGAFQLRSGSVQSAYTWYAASLPKRPLSLVKDYWTHIPEHTQSMPPGQSGVSGSVPGGLHDRSVPISTWVEETKPPNPCSQPLHGCLRKQMFDKPQSSFTNGVGNSSESCLLVSMHVNSFTHVFLNGLTHLHGRHSYFSSCPYTDFFFRIFQLQLTFSATLVSGVQPSG